MTSIKDLQPQGIWQSFYALTQVPRPSGHLAKVKKFLLDWAAERGIEAFEDKGENIIMRKPATPGYENRKTVTLQAHMDIVPQKAKDSDHNFETDPIRSRIDGEWVRTYGTTLGADDGLGVATILALFEATNIEHGPLEGFITADEESTMGGVNNMEVGTLKGDILLNLDNETEGEFIIGSAGGINLTATRSYEAVPAEGDATLHISLHHLLGGHSGIQINEGHANANKLMSRVLLDLFENCGARLSSWHGGNMRNAIPAYADAIVTLPSDKVAEAKEKVAHWFEVFKEEYRGVEEQFTLETLEAERPTTNLPVEVQDAVVAAIAACHNGVLRFIPTIPHIVETSSNLAIVEIGDGNIFVKDLIRSSQNSMRRYCEQVLTQAFKLAGMEVVLDGAYIEWQPAPKSEIVDLMKAKYQELFGKPASVTVIHAGLECSIIGASYPHMDIISFGPTVRCPHTPDECCHIPSVAKYWELVVATLKDIPVK